MALSNDEATARTIAAILVAGQANEDQDDPAVWAAAIKRARKVVSAAVPGALP